MKILILNLLFLSWAFLDCSVLSAAERASDLLKMNFKSVAVVDGDLVIEMNDIGSKYRYKLGSQEEFTMLNYGEKFIMPLGFEKATLVARDVVLIFEQINKDENKYCLEVKVDQRSANGGVIEVRSEFIIHDQKIEDIQTGEAKSLPLRTNEEIVLSTPWSIIVVLIVTATGLLGLLLKRRSSKLSVPTNKQ